VTYNLRNLDHMHIPGSLQADPNIFAVTSLGSGKYNIESFTVQDNYLSFRIPSELPVGAKVTVMADTLIGTGEPCELNITSFPDNTYGAIGGIGTSEINKPFKEYNPNGSYWQQQKVSTYVTALNRYVTCKIGFYDIGEADFRNLRVTVEGDGVDAGNMDMENFPTLNSQFYDMTALENQWLATAVNGGVVTVDPGVDIHMEKTAVNQTACVDHTIGLTDAELAINRSVDIRGTEGFIVELDCTRTSGSPSIEAFYLDGAFASVTSLSAHVTIADGVQKFWFPAVDGTESVRFSIGFAAGSRGVFDLRSVKISTLGTSDTADSVLSYMPFAVSLLKTAGVWAIDYGTYGDSQKSHGGVTDITTNAFSISLNLKDSARGVQIGVGQIDDTDYDVLVNASATTNTQIVVVFNRSTGVTIDPDLLADGTVINVLCGGFR